MEVSFRKTEVPIETMRDGTETQEMDIIEIKYPDGKVIAFPADMKSPETGIRYRDMYPGKYQAFKNGEPDPGRVAQLEQEIAERQAELGALRGTKAPDDERVQDNLGYGEIKPDENSHDTAKPLPGEEPGRIDQPTVLGPEPVKEPA
jgi:hypothetical protein